MNDITPSAYANSPGTPNSTIQRLLPGPIERVWAYLTESDLAQATVCSGEMQMSVGTPFELVWRNDVNYPIRRSERGPRGLVRSIAHAKRDHRARSAA